MFKKKWRTRSGSGTEGQASASHGHPMNFNVRPNHDATTCFKSGDTALHLHTGGKRAKKWPAMQVGPSHPSQRGAQLLRLDRFSVIQGRMPFQS
mmetsp:Transcript_6473/g.18093  ORF Transcript_6473/g.18093 Transcript_6473/m.18093 type:complete len:94 (+) Transcript_6473:276-557(+)